MKDDDQSPSARLQDEDEPAWPAVTEGVLTGGMAGVLAALLAGVLGWLVTIWARRRYPAGRRHHS